MSTLNPNVLTEDAVQGIPAMSKKVSLVAGSVCHTARGLLVEKVSIVMAPCMPGLNASSHNLTFAVGLSRKPHR